MPKIWACAVFAVIGVASFRAIAATCLKHQLNQISASKPQVATQPDGVQKPLLLIAPEGCPANFEPALHLTCRVKLPLIDLDLRLPHCVLLVGKHACFSGDTRQAGGWRAKKNRLALVARGGSVGGYLNQISTKFRPALRGRFGGVDQEGAG